MNLAEKYALISNAFKEHPIIDERLSEIFDDTDNIGSSTLASIVNNKQLFMLYAEAEFDKYHDLSRALAMLLKDDMLIYFPDLKLYAIIGSMDKLINIKSRALKLADGNENIAVNISQIVLSSQKQRLVFRCLLEKYLDRMVEFIEKYFGCMTFVSYGECIEIITNVNVGSDAESRAIFNEMIIKMCRVDVMMANSISQPGIMFKYGFNFTIRSLNAIETYGESHIDNTCTPNVKRSSGETEVYNYLTTRAIKFIEQHKFDGCVHKKPLPFDFYLPGFNACIEYDGKQHYEPVEYFGGQAAFDAQKIRDTIKDVYCYDNGIELLRISYKTSADELITILDKFLRGQSTGDEPFEADGELLDCNVPVIDIKIDKAFEAREWIRNNLPNEKEVTVDYYQRYYNDIQNPVVTNIFGKYVRERGYVPTKGTNNRYWSKS